MKSSTLPRYTTDSVTAPDGTVIGYRQLGSGPGVVLLHGALQAAQNLMRLAAALSDEFTVYVPDRRGRGLSGPPGDDYTIQKDCADLAALLDKTGARNVFGLSSGAIIALEAAWATAAIRKVAAYEPPLRSQPPAWMTRYRRELSRDRLAAAFVTAVKGSQASPIFAALPRFLLVPLVTVMMDGDDKRVAGDDVSIKALVPTLQFEAHIDTEADDWRDRFADVRADVLLLGGSKSATYLRTTLDDLGGVLPSARRVRIPGLGHLGPDDRGHPERVAQELRYFFRPATG